MFNGNDLKGSTLGLTGAAAIFDKKNICNFKQNVLIWSVKFLNSSYCRCNSLMNRSFTVSHSLQLTNIFRCKLKVCYRCSPAYFLKKIQSLHNTILNISVMPVQNNDNVA